MGRIVNSLLYYLFFIIFLVSTSLGDYLEVKPKSGDGINILLRRYNLESNSSNKQKFIELNQENLLKNYGLNLSKKYLLPIKLYKFDGNTIRSSIGNDDYNYALSIQHYNDSLFAAGIKKGNFREDLELWVPEFEFFTSLFGKSFKSKEKEDPLKNIYMPILGKEHERFKEISKTLRHCAFYLVAGHGGPDPGAVKRKNGNLLTEDEYAYDVILRLGKQLAKHGATVYFIVQDPKDGIREKQILNNSKDEFYYGGGEISTNQRTRLQQRCDVINNLYEKNESGATEHHVVSIHIDSRGSRQIDIFFYHAEGSQKGYDAAKTLLNTIKEKYKQAQPGRGYEGSLSSRDLYILNHTIPTVTFIELGNIMHNRDQQRIIIPNNRQAIANWLKDGLLEVYKR